MSNCALPELAPNAAACRGFEDALATAALYALLRLDLHPSMAQRACWLCGCLPASPDLASVERRRYLGALKQEIGAVAERLEGCGQTASVVFGVGAPITFEPDEIADVLDVVEAALGLTNMARITVETTPETTTTARANALVSLGVGRVTLFDVETPRRSVVPEVWFEGLECAVGVLREADIDDIGIAFFADLPASVEYDRREIAARLLSLGPDRIHAHSLGDRVRLDPGFRSVRLPPNKMDGVARQIRAAGYGQVAPGVFTKPERRLEVAAAVDARLTSSTLGFGAGALSHFGGMDFRNLRSIDAYVAAAHGSGLAVELIAPRGR
jgi:coproporphyrinogen III oxidase-like Fe-S oxidoreductase